LTFETGSKLLVLGEYAFGCCSSLGSIYLPSSLETISPYCFQYCGTP
jgi:hypothetical protein